MAELETALGRLEKAVGESGVESINIHGPQPQINAEAINMIADSIERLHTMESTQAEEGQ